MTDDVPGSAAQPGQPTRGPLGAGFRLLWTSSGLSNLADGIAKIA